MSAYLDKVESKKKWTFEKFVDSLSKATDNITTCDGADPFYGLNWCSDPREYKHLHIDLSALEMISFLTYIFNTSKFYSNY